MEYTPRGYEFINNYNGLYRPTNIHVHDNATFRYFERALYQRVLSRFKFEIPKEWDEEYFKYVLFNIGYICILDDDKYGVIPQFSTLEGYGIYYQPIRASVNTTLVRKDRMEIGKDCEIIKINPDYLGITDIIDIYAEKLALLDQGISMSIINNKLGYMVGVKNKAAGETFKKMFDQINEGNPAVVFDKYLVSPNNSPDKDPFYFVDRNLAGNYITDKQLQDNRTIMAQFDTEIGLNNTNFEKKERLVVDEVNANNEEVLARATVWLETMKETMAKANSLFNINMNVEFRPLEGATK